MKRLKRFALYINLSKHMFVMKLWYRSNHLSITVTIFKSIDLNALTRLQMSTQRILKQKRPMLLIIEKG